MPQPGALGAPRRLFLDTAMSTIPLTTTGAELLRQELHRLKTVERPNATTAIAEARTHGDLSENAEYDAAKERQGFVEARIKEIESKLSNAQVIDPLSLDAGGRVVFGATVELADSDAGDRVTYQIVGDDEADIRHGKISVSSPIARALVALGCQLVATRGTAAALTAAGVPVTAVNKVAEGRPHIVDMIKNDEIALVVNTVE